MADETSFAALNVTQKATSMAISLANEIYANEQLVGNLVAASF